MVEGSSSMWNNLMVTFLKIKKFNKNKASFPLYDALGELYDGYLTEGNCNIVSMNLPQVEESLQEIHGEDEVVILDEECEDIVVHRHEDEAASHNTNERNEEVLERRVATLSQDQRKAAFEARKKEEKEGKKVKKNLNIETMTERYLEMRTKQVEEFKYSVKRCISVLSSMDVIKEEKAKAYTVFKKQENREVFLCASEDDLEATLIWLRSEIV